MSQADVIRTIKIKTNTLKRLQKEFSYYLAEKDKEQSRLDRLRTEGADAHDLKQAVRPCDAQQPDSRALGPQTQSTAVLQLKPSCILAAFPSTLCSASITILHRKMF
jgi:hypothetical protein